MATCRLDKRGAAREVFESTTEFVKTAIVAGGVATFARLNAAYQQPAGSAALVRR